VFIETIMAWGRCIYRLLLELHGPAQHGLSPYRRRGLLAMWARVDQGRYALGGNGPYLAVGH